MLSAAAVRTTAVVVCVIGIAGMIVTSILNHNGAAVTFGLVTAVAIVCSMVAKAVAASTEQRLVGSGGPGAQTAPGPEAGRAGRAPHDEATSEALARRVEGQVQAIVTAGADEEAVRHLVGEAVRLGRSLGWQ